jgi:hypothetical protein
MLRPTVIGATLILLLACRGDDRGLGPGDRIGPARLVRGAAEDVTLWDFCDPELPEPGVYERACSVPSVHRLRIGPGWRASSTEALQAEWGELDWHLSFDRRAIDLEAFGTLPDTTLADGRVVREWNVTVEGLTEDTHRLRSMMDRDDQTYAVTWVVRVGR